jgi:hypothetical protein
MQRILENIVIYLSLVFRPRVLVKIARERLAVSGQLAEALKSATELSQTMHDIRDIQSRLYHQPDEERR